MSLAVNSFLVGGWEMVSSQSPLVLLATLINTNTTQVSGDVTVEIQGQTPNAENTTLYTFEMGYMGTTGSGTYTHTFKLDITDIIRNLSNNPLLQNDTGGTYDEQNRLATKIKIEVKSSGEGTLGTDIYFAHGFNQVNDPDKSCLVDFADPAIESMMPIAPGVPMLWHIFSDTQNAAETWSFILTGASGTIGTVVKGTGIAKGLYQIDDYPDGGGSFEFGESVYDDMGDTPKEYELSLEGSTTGEIAKVNHVAFRKTCTGDVVLAWLNRFGTYSYMAFERFAILKGKQSHIGSYDLEVNDLSEMQSKKASRGYSGVRNTITAVAKGIPTEYFEAIEDLFYSMDVYYFTGTVPNYGSEEVNWLRVQVSGNLTERRKYNKENVSVEILLPEKYTQIR